MADFNPYNQARNLKPIVNVTPTQDPFSTLGQANRNLGPIVPIPAEQTAFSEAVLPHRREVPMSDIKRQRDAQRLFMPQDVNGGDSANFKSFIKGS